MELDSPTPIHIIQDNRYARQDGWELDDISLCSSGNIAVSGSRPYQSYVSIYSSSEKSDSRGEPTLLYHKQFTHKVPWWPQRYISFIKPNSTEIITCQYDKVQVIDYNRDVVLRSREVNGYPSCVSVSESQIFIGLLWSNYVIVYGNDLNKIKSIILEGIRGDWPRVIAAAADRLYVCTVRYDRAIVFNQFSGKILTEYNTGQDRRSGYCISLAVNTQLQILATVWGIGWSVKGVSVHSFSNNNCLVDFNVESGVTRIRISDRGRIVTGNKDTGAVTIFVLEKPSTSYNERKLVQTKRQSMDVALSLFKEPISESDSCLDVGTVNTAGNHEKVPFNEHSEMSTTCKSKSPKEEGPVEEPLKKEEPSTSYGEKKTIKTGSASMDSALSLIKEEISESDSELDVLTVNPAETHTQSHHTSEVALDKSSLMAITRTSKFPMTKGHAEEHLDKDEPSTSYGERNIVKIGRPSMESALSFIKEKISESDYELDVWAVSIEETHDQSHHKSEVALNERSVIAIPSASRSPMSRGPVEEHLDKHFATTRPREVDADTIEPDEHSVMPLPGKSNLPTAKRRVEKHLEEHSEITGRREMDTEVQLSMETKAVITKKGGVLEIPNTGVVLQIPPYALPDDKEYCTIQMRIIPRNKMAEKGNTFSSNSCTVVELLPNNLRFQCPVRLSLPHCLVLDGTKVRQARIFLSHHKKGSKPRWEEQPHLSYHLEDTYCIILLNSFSWVKFSVDDEIVTAKKFIVYSAVRRIYPKDTVAEIRIGYYLDLPDEKMVEADTTDITVVHRKTFFFVKGRGKHPLKVSLDETFPNVWQYTSPKPPLREIPYRQMSSLSKHSVIYTLHREAGMKGDLLCVFTVSQEGQVPVQLAAHLQVLQKDSLSRENKDSRNTFRNSFAVEKSVNRNGGTVTIPDSGVKLELPPDAIKEECLIRIKITPNRVLEDNVTSFCSSSCTAVEISPCNFPLNCSAKLSLPHCLTLKEKKKKKNRECKARIFVNEEEGTPSPWKEKEDLSYELKNGVVIVHLEKLCCVRFSIDNAAVEGKRIVLYPAAKSLQENDHLAVVEVGYYSDIPGGQELLRLNPHLEDGPKANYIFMEKQKLALQLLLNDVNPPSWKCRIPYENPQEIPFKTIASSMEHSHLYILQKESDHAGSVICEFTASQKDSPFSSEISMRLNSQEDHSNGNEQPSLDKAGAQSMITLFQHLSENIDAEWRNVGRNLGLQEAELNHIQIDYPSRRQESVFQMFLHWKQSRGKNAKYNVLIKALELSGRKDLADNV